MDRSHQNRKLIEPQSKTTKSKTRKWKIEKWYKPSSTRCLIYELWSAIRSKSVFYPIPMSVINYWDCKICFFSGNSFDVKSCAQCYATRTSEDENMILGELETAIKQMSSSQLVKLTDYAKQLITNTSVNPSSTPCSSSSSESKFGNSPNKRVLRSAPPERGITTGTGGGHGANGNRNNPSSGSGRSGNNNTNNSSVEDEEAEKSSKKSSKKVDVSEDLKSRHVDAWSLQTRELLHRAIADSDSITVRGIISRYWDGQTEHFLDKFGRVWGGNTPLMMACKLGASAEVIELLLEKDYSNPNASNEFGHTPLYIACVEGMSIYIYIIRFRMNVDILIYIYANRSIGSGQARSASSVS